VLELCDGILARALPHTFECETRLDRLDVALLDVMQRAGLRAMSFGVESVLAATLKKVGRRPIPEAHQRTVLARCRTLGVVTAAFYVLGFNEDTWESISATIDYAIQLGSTVAQFKILTPYPATPLYAQMASRVTETDWEMFDGFTPTFTHPHLSHEQMRFLLGAAYTRFYVRPSYLLNYLRLERPTMQRFARRLDTRVARMHGRRELATMERVLSC
jgi:anaerobic magnesium-protoporphyrin IX monomethyl ester cyclase